MIKPDDVETIALIKKSGLFREFSPEELALLLPLMREEKVKENTYIIREGEKGEDLYIIKEGEVEVFKEDKELNQKYLISILGRGKCVGEMSLVGNSIRSATVRTTKPCTLIVLPLAKIHSLSKQSLDYSKITLNLAEHFGERLKDTNEVVIKQLRNELKMTQLYDRMGRLVIYLNILLVVYFITFKAFVEFFPSSGMNKYISSLLIIALGFSAFLFVKKEGLPLSFCGVTLKNWQANLREGVIYTLPFLVVLTILKGILIYTVPAFEDVTLFHTGSEPSHFFLFWEQSRPSATDVYLLPILYLILVPIQEFIVRGSLQSILEQFFRGPHNVIWAIVVSNLLFWIFHGLQSLTVATAAFLFGLFWGWMYARQHSLVGICASHILVGGYSFIVLDVQKMLTI